MRRPFGYLLAWTLVTVVSVAAAWLGIRSVLVAATPDRVSPLSAAELRDAAGSASAGGASTDKPTSKPAPAPSPAPRATNPPPPTPSINGVWAPETDGRGGTAYRRTLRVEGGEVVVWCAAGNVQVLSSRANRGYTVREDRYDAQSILVSFLSPKHTSRVYAAWRDGPVAELTESVA